MDLYIKTRKKCMFCWHGSNMSSFSSIDISSFSPIDLFGEIYEGNFRSHIKWEDLRYDFENKRDTVYGFIWLSTTPKHGIEKLKEIQHRVPFKRLHGDDIINEGMWILIIRLPQPLGYSYIPPNSRKDILRLQMKFEQDHDDEKLIELQSKIKKIKHSTDTQLILLPNGQLMAKPPLSIVCSCGATGHHLPQCHNDIKEIIHNGVNLLPNIPDWIEYEELEDEILQLPKGGIDVTIREIKAKIPLRLARMMKLHGLKIDGDISQCGINKINKLRFDPFRFFATEEINLDI